MHELCINTFSSKVSVKLIQIFFWRSLAWLRTKSDLKLNVNVVNSQSKIAHKHLTTLTLKVLSRIVADNMLLFL